MMMLDAPLWQKPAVWLSRWHRGLESFIEVDRAMLAGLRIPNNVILIVILVITGVPSFFHAIAQFGDANNLSLIRIAVSNVYTESMPFMVAALFLGMLAPTAGAGLVAAFIPLDLIASALQQQELTPLLPAVGGRAVSYWLLWLLVVEIPLLIRTSFLSLDRAGVAQRGVAFALATGAGFVMPWVWAQAVTMLIRPVFTWSDLFSPYYAAVAPVQEGGNLLALVGAIGAAGATVLHLRLTPGQGIPLFTPARRRRPLGLIPITVVLTLALLGGLITSVVDLVLLGAAVIAARPLAVWLRRRLGWWSRVSEIPWVVRFAIAFVFAYVLAGLIVVPLFGIGGSEFLPLVLAEILILVVYELLCGEEEAEQPGEAAKAATGTTGLLILTGGFFLALLFLPLPAGADNCSSRTDCYPAPWPAAAGAAGAGGAAMMNRNRPNSPDKPSIKKARDATNLLSKAPGTKQLSIPKLLLGKLLGWQFDNANEISRQLGSDPPRDDYTEIAEATVRAVPPIPFADYLGAEITAAVSKSFQAHQEWRAHAEAAIVSFDRYGGAKKAGAREWLQAQAEAVIRHKKAMAPALRASADAVQEAWRLAESFKPTSSIPDEMLNQLTGAEMDFARGLGIEDGAIASRQEAIAGDRGVAGDKEIDDIATAYRRMATSFERLPVPRPR
jgi:hypothetical protein